MNAFVTVWDESLMIHERDSPIISLDKMVIWLSDGPVAHSIFEHEYLKYYKGKIIPKKELVNISKEHATSRFLWPLAPHIKLCFFFPFLSIVRKVMENIYLCRKIFKSDLCPFHPIMSTYMWKWDSYVLGTFKSLVKKCLSTCFPGNSI